MFEHATAFLLQRHWKSHIHWRRGFYTFTHSIFTPCFYCGSSVMRFWGFGVCVTWPSYTQEMPGVDSSCGLLFCFKSCFSFILFVRDGNRHMKPWVKPPIFISLHESSQEAFKVEFFKCFTGTKWPQLTETARVYPYPVLMTSVSTLSRYRSFLADLDSPPRAANRADPPVSHKHPKHKR